MSAPTMFDDDNERLVIALMYASPCERICNALADWFWPPALQGDQDYDVTWRPGTRWSRPVVARVIHAFDDAGRRKSNLWAARSADHGINPPARWKR